MSKQRTGRKVPGSFRDPSGFLFYQDGLLYRQINAVYRKDYDYLMNSGLYNSLVDANLLVPHTETDFKSTESDIAYKIIQPEEIQFLSYPYEWCFSQLKDAALTTLKIQKKAMDFGMCLKDSSAYNIQFRKGKPVLIDTLSFEIYKEGHPWVAYRQFCQQFLAPLVLMSYKDIRLNQLLRIYIDGIPLDLASSLLPLRTSLKFSVLSHINLHAKSQKHYADKVVDTSGNKMKRISLLGLIDNLESAVSKLKWRVRDTEWGEYYKDTNYSDDALQHKKEIVAEYLGRIKTKSVWDLGGNVGMFSRIASDSGIQTISFDNDPDVFEANNI